MASPSGNSSGSSKIQNSGSEEDVHHLMDQRKRKRMQSNRESARRSRMRKQKHLDDLMVQANELRIENRQILNSINVTTQRYHEVDTENSILRARMAELTQRLQSLNEILSYINKTTATGFYETDHPFPSGVDSFTHPTTNMLYLNQPIMASADMFHY